jgi:hypothetical protein
MLLVVVATVAQLTWAASPSASCDAVVSFAHGADVSSGGSADHPFKSIAFALSKNPAGRICLRGSEVNRGTGMAIRWWWELMWCEKRLCVGWRHGNGAWHACARCAGLKNMCRRCQTRNGVSQRTRCTVCTPMFTALSLVLHHFSQGIRALAPRSLRRRACVMRFSARYFNLARFWPLSGEDKFGK